MTEHNSNRYISVDEIIKKAYQQKTAKDTDIDLEKAWGRFNQKYPPVKKQKPLLKLILAACLIGLILGTPLFLFPSEGGAFGDKLFKSIKLFLSGKVQSTEISFNSSPGKKESAEDYLNPEILSNLQDVPYQILLPVDLLGTYKLEKVETANLGNSTEVTITMTGEKSKQIVITEINIIKGFQQGTSYDIEDAQMKNVKVKGQDAVLVNYKNKLITLSWIDMGIFISITGAASEDDILMLASAMRRVNYSTQ